jgi:site-specific DNA-cytosine methylase
MWERIQSSAYSKAHGKIVDLGGVSSTVRASYRSGWKLHSVFVANDNNTNDTDKNDSNNPPRFYTPRECARLQGFPESYQFGAVEDAPLYTTIGILFVTPPLKASFDPKYYLAEHTLQFLLVVFIF